MLHNRISHGKTQHPPHIRSHSMRIVDSTAIPKIDERSPVHRNNRFARYNPTCTIELLQKTADVFQCQSSGTAKTERHRFSA
jgi:hypothetical protein